MAEAAPDVPVRSRAESARAADAVVERGILATHAETPGAGAETFSLHEGLLLSAGHSFTDDVQLTGGGLVPAWDGAPWAAFAQGKLVLARTEAATLAVRGTGSLLAQRGGDGIAATLGAGILIDAYPPPRWLSLHGGASVHGARGTPVSQFIPFDGDATIGMLELGATARTSRRSALLVEAWLPITADDGEVRAFASVLVPWAVRWGGPRLALDVGMLSGRGPVIGDSPLVVGWPYVAIGGRLLEPG